MAVPHTGSCHCGAVRVELTTLLAREAIRWRECSCTYCQRMQPAWWSDPAGQATLHAAPGALAAYRFGTQTADFLRCATCGFLVAAACELGGRRLAVINLKLLPSLDPARLQRDIRSYDGEDAAARLARRARNWMPVSLPGPG